MIVARSPGFTFAARLRNAFGSFWRRRSPSRSRSSTKCSRARCDPPRRAAIDPHDLLRASRSIAHRQELLVLLVARQDTTRPSGVAADCSHCAAVELGYTGTVTAPRPSTARSRSPTRAASRHRIPTRSPRVTPSAEADPRPSTASRARGGGSLPRAVDLAHELGGLVMRVDGRRKMRISVSDVVAKFGPGRMPRAVGVRMSYRHGGGARIQCRPSGRAGRNGRKSGLRHGVR